MRIRHAVCLLALLSAGCAAAPKVIDGTHFCLGAYVPYDGGFYGLDVVEYTSGCVVKALPTNAPWKVEREYCSTNRWLFGMVETNERTKMTVEAKK